MIDPTPTKLNEEFRKLFLLQTPLNINLPKDFRQFQHCLYSGNCMYSYSRLKMSIFSKKELGGFDSLHTFEQIEEQSGIVEQVETETIFQPKRSSKRFSQEADDWDEDQEEEASISKFLVKKIIICCTSLIILIIVVLLYEVVTDNLGSGTVSSQTIQKQHQLSNLPLHHDESKNKEELTKEDSKTQLRSKKTEEIDPHDSVLGLLNEKVDPTKQQINEIKPQEEQHSKSKDSSSTNSALTNEDLLRKMMSIKAKMHEYFEVSKMIDSCKSVLQQKGYLYDYVFPLNKVKDKSKVSEFVKPSKDPLGRNITIQQYERAIQLTQLNHRIGFDSTLKEDLTQNLETQYQAEQLFPNNPINFQKDPCRSEPEFQLKETLVSARANHYQSLQQKYDIEYYKSKKEIPFCIVVNSYMNAQNGLLYRNLDSIFMQNYSNYHVVYTDDNSPDNTSAVAREYILEESKISPQKIVFIENSEKKGATENIYNAISQHCNSGIGQVVVMLDGDDSFIGQQVLSLYNAVYQQSEVALLYSQFLISYDNQRFQLGISRPYDPAIIKLNKFRGVTSLHASHLKTFYVDLYLKIKVQDLQYADGTGFYGGGSDTVMMVPMLEMASPKIKYLPEITYEYRYDTGLTGNGLNKAQQTKAVRKMYRTPRYQRLQNFDFMNSSQKKLHSGLHSK